MEKRTAKEARECGKGNRRCWGELRAWRWMPRTRVFLRRALREAAARLRLSLQPPELWCMYALLVVGRLCELAFHVSALLVPALVYPLLGVASGMCTPFSSVTGVAVWLGALLDAAVVSPQTAASQLAAVAALPPAVRPSASFRFLPAIVRRCAGAETHSGVGGDGSAAAWLEGRFLDFAGLCFPLGEPRASGRASAASAFVSAVHANASATASPSSAAHPLRASAPLGVYCRLLVDVPMVTLALHLSQFFLARGLALSSSGGASGNGGSGASSPASVSAASPPSSSAASRGGESVSPEMSGSAVSVSAASGGGWLLRRALAETPSPARPADAVSGVGKRKRGEGRRSWLSRLRRVLATSSRWAVVGGVKRLYLTAVLYLLSRFLYAERADVLGSPFVAANSLSAHLMESRAADVRGVLMAVSVFFLGMLVASLCALLLLKRYAALPDQLLHKTLVLGCSRLTVHRREGNADEVSAAALWRGHEKRCRRVADRLCVFASGLQTCVFCFDDLREGELLREITLCGHKFHGERSGAEGAP